MDWLERWNEAVASLEQSLEGTVDYDELARIACCSSYHFQRMFSYMAGITLGEYIRRRRMTLAAFELHNGAKVVDVALKFGYDSPTSFNRAFQSVHELPPSAAQKKNAALKAYPPIYFHMTIKGEAAMEYRMMEKDAFRIMGAGIPLSQDLESSFREVPAFWGRAAQEGLIPRLIPLMDQEPMGILGVSCCHGEEWRYYIAVSSSRPLPDGFQETTVPACTWAVFTVEGNTPDSIQALQRRVVTEWLPTSGYEYANAPDIEVYLDADPANRRVEVWLPVVKK